MTDRHAGYVVALEKDIREDEVEAIMLAIAMIKGVLDVAPIVSEVSIDLAQLRIRSELAQKFYDFYMDLIH